MTVNRPMNEKRSLLFEKSALTGIEEVDRQHQHLLSLFNATGQALTENASPVRCDASGHRVFSG